MFMRENRHHWHTRRADVLLYVSQWWRFPLINISWWKRSSLREHRFGRKMSPAWLNSLSTPVEDGTGVLNSMNKSMRDRSR